MVKNSKHIIYLAHFLAFVLTIFSACEKTSKEQSDLAIEDITFRDIPGITESEIEAIEHLQKKYGFLTYGVNLTTEAYPGKDGEIEGYAVMFCEWLSGLFRMQFKPVYYEWGGLLNGLESGDIDFTGEIMSTPENLAGYYMSRPTINRSIKSYRIKGSIPIEGILRSRQPRFAFLKGAVVSDDINKNTGYDFEIITVYSHKEAYKLLDSGKVDAFFGLDTADGFFNAYSNVAGEMFFPMIFRASCLATQKEELKPIISVLEKIMDARTLEYLTSLQKKGWQEYMENRMYTLLTEEEHSYIKNHPVIPVGAEFSNYPVTFWNTNVGEWQGIFFEALDEIGKLTGLKFEIGNGPETSLLDVISKLESGEILFMPELFKTKEYEDRFIWSDIPILNDNFVFISRADFRNININDVFHLKIGLREHTIYSELFKNEFPSHQNFVEYRTQEKAWEALKNGEFDVLFAGKRRLLIYTNYYEDASYKLNLVFNYTYDSFFAYNKDEAILKSIIDKAIQVIDINNISNQWIYKTFDYRSKIARAQRPWLIGAVILSFITLSLVTVLLIRSRYAGRALEQMVKRRTSDLVFETSKLEAMIDSIPDLIFCKDTDLKYTQCNNSFEQYMGIKEKQLIGKTNEDESWFSAEYEESIHNNEQIVISQNRILTFEEKVRSPVTGKEGVFETVKAPIRQNGVVVGLIAIIRDISQRKMMEKELAVQTSMLKTMITSLPDGVFCKDLDSNYTLCNGIMAELLGKKEEDIIGKNDEEVFGFTAEMVKGIREVDRKVINERIQMVVEENIKCFDGVTRLFETVKSPLIQDGEVTGIIGIGRDITMRKEIERDLAFKTSQLQVTLASIPDLMFCKDTDLKYTQCNKAFEKFIGVSEAELIGKADRDGSWLNHEQVERIHNIELAVIEENRIFTLEEKVRSPVTGEEGVFETVKAPIRQNGVVVGIIAIIRNITKRKEMEEEVMAASRAKSTFLANMSHELRTPLNVVIGLTDLILEDDNMNEHVTSNLIKISSAGNTLLSIVNDILDFSKIESGKLDLSSVEYYTSSLLNDIITMVITRLGEKPIIFHLDIEDTLPNKLYGDDLRVKQIFTNLLTNSVKYTREGSINLKVRCTREDDSVWMEITVSDTGIGIRENDLKKLFLDYYQINEKANRNIEGTGLGLPITKRLTEMMNGEINAESQYGRGTTFRVRIRQGFVNDTPIGADIAGKLRHFCYADNKRIVTKKLVRINLSYAKVLVVDDMQTNLDVASGLLRKYKMQVDCLNSGQASIERIRAGTPVYDAIFMDHMMPGMDGIEAADAIRALGTEYAKNIPIIALTANAIQGTEQMFFAHGFQAFISKPIDIIELDSVIRKWVRDDTHDNTLISSAPSEGISEDENMIIKIPGVDTQKGLSLYAGEMDVYLPLLRSYVYNTPKVLEKMRTVSGETLPSYVVTVHGLKGTSAGIGAEEIRFSAQDMETKSRAGDLKSVLEHNGKLIADTEIIVANIKAWLNQYDANREKPLLKAPDRELLSQLKKYCESYDMDGVDQVMSELESSDYEESGELIAWLREKIDISKMGEAAQRLAGEGIS
ncbi:MAG: PAS domain-containing protein [Treponema sp.]|jgi:PAS domain S-box-containing protein|nr:PAS domain-containing protein [Treponema sp.]